MSRSRIVISAQLEQGCTAGCGKMIRVGTTITHTAEGWQHLDCAKASRSWSGNTSVIHISKPDELTIRLEAHRDELTASEIAYVENMIRRRHSA